MNRLKKRAEFLAVAKGVRAGRRAFALQAAPVGAPEAAPRVGFTVTKKTGGAVERNRIRRRLRAAVARTEARAAAGFDYVLVGRRDALHLSFDLLVADLGGAFEQVNATLRRAPKRPA